MSPQLASLLALLIPLAAAGVIAALHRHPDLRELATLVAAAALFLVVTTLHGPVSAGDSVRVVLAEPVPGLGLVLDVEPLGLLFALVASGLWIVTSLYSIGYMRGHHESNQTRFYLFFALSLAAAMGVALAGNLLTLFVFYEALTLSTFPLVTHHGTDEARRAGRVYLGILLSTSIGLLLPAIIWTWQIAGTTDFRAAGLLAGKLDGWPLAMLVAMFALGTGKAALMPLHRWLPRAMVAPTPVSALLHAVAVVKAGVFTVLKVSVYVFGIDLLAQTGASRPVMWLAAVTILVASLVALRQDNLKARLAYSTISQLSYVVLGAMLATDAGFNGGAQQIAMHAFGKITLFFCAGAILVGAHKTEVSEMSGLGRSMPVTFAAFLVGALSIVGLPPMGGTWAKWYLLLGSLEAGQLAMVAVLVASSLLNIAYLVSIPARAFLLPPQATADGTTAPQGGNGIREAPLLCVVPPAATAIGCIILFFGVDAVQSLIELVPLR